MTDEELFKLIQGDFNLMYSERRPGKKRECVRQGLIEGTLTVRKAVAEDDVDQMIIDLYDKIKE